MLVDRFLENAIEIDVDALCDGEETYVCAVMQHVEEAGVHSGDSSCVLPAPSLDPETTAAVEDTLALIRRERPDGVVVQFGGQTPLPVAGPIEAAGHRILGTSPASIDLAEDRERFAELLAELGIRCPPWRTAATNVSFPSHSASTSSSRAPSRNRSTSPPPAASATSAAE